MNTTVHVPGLNLPADWVDELARIYPEGKTSTYWFSFKLEEKDPRARQLLGWLAELGLRPWEDVLRPPDERAEFTFRLVREYDARDYDSVRYVRLLPRVFGNGLFRDPEGRIKMIEGDFPRRADFIMTPMSWVVVPERVRGRITAEGFQGVTFKPTVLVGGSRLLSKATPKSWSSYGEPWWELTSDIVLPPLSPTTDMFDRDGNPVRNADCSRGCFVREGFYVQPEYRYRTSDLKKVEPFDFARTAETFGNPGAADSWHYIASARFREFCVGHKWNCDWIPVRLDD